MPKIRLEHETTVIDRTCVLRTWPKLGAEVRAIPNIKVSEGGEAAAAAAARRKKIDKTSNNYKPSNHWTGPPAERGEKTPRRQGGENGRKEPRGGRREGGEERDCTLETNA